MVHDEASRGYPMESLAWRQPTQPVWHHRHAPIWNQNDIGACTANAALGMLVTGPLWRAEHVFDETDCLRLYEEETRLDDRQIPGQYPPDDTGSSGLYACKALRNRGLITAYRHAFGTRTTLAMLARQPVAIGIPWMNSMFDAAHTGMVTVDRSSGVAGGHEVCLDGIDPPNRRVRFANSWGTGYGNQGWGYLSYDDLDWLLHQNGDAVTVLL